MQPKITTCTLGLATVVITLGNLASFPSYSYGAPFVSKLILFRATNFQSDDLSVQRIYFQSDEFSEATNFQSDEFCRATNFQSDDLSVQRIYFQSDEFSEATNFQSYEF